MFSHLYKQSAVLSVVSGTDEYSRPRVTSTATINCKIVFKSLLVINSTGKEVTANGNLRTNTEVKIDDIITYNDVDYTVIQSNPIVDFDGNNQGYQVYF